MAKKSLNGTLTSIGKRAFVYLFDFASKNTDIEVVRAKLKSEGWDKTINSRYSSTKGIFNNNDEIEALKNIIASSRIGWETRQKAQEILDEYLEVEPEVISSVLIIDDKKIIDQLIEIAYSKGLDKDDIKDAIISKINEVVGADETVSIQETEREKKVVSQINQEPTYISVNQETRFNSIDDLQYLKVDFIRKGKTSKNTKELSALFKSRFRTQNRKYKQMCYMPTLFAKLEKNFFKPYLEEQVRDVFTFIFENDKYTERKVSDFDKITIRAGELIGFINKKEYTLHFMFADDQFASFDGYIESFEDVSLAHKESVYYLVNESALQYPTLLEFSKIVGPMVNKVEDIKKSVNSDIIIDKIKSSQIDINALKQELKSINERMICTLMPKRINIAMGKN